MVKVKSLGVLIMNGCPLTSAYLSALGSCLHQTTTLKILTLTNTTMETQGTKQLASALQKNKSLKEVKEKDTVTSISDEGIRVLEAVLEKHTTVRKYTVTDGKNSATGSSKKQCRLS